MTTESLNQLTSVQEFTHDLIQPLYKLYILLYDVLSVETVSDIIL